MERHARQYPHKWLDWRSVKFQNAPAQQALGGYQPSSFSSGTSGSQTGNENINTTGVSNTNQSSSGNQQQANTYLPWQQQMQGQVAGAQSNLLAGNVPTSLTNPQASTQAYMQNFNQYVAPELAAQYGAGSPAIGASLSSGLTNLAAQNYQAGVSNYQNAINSAQTGALTPTGQTGQQATQGTGTTTSTQEMTELLDMLQASQSNGGSVSSLGFYNPTLAMPVSNPPP
jgi:hypothetical protein